MTTEITEEAVERLVLLCEERDTRDVALAAFVGTVSNEESITEIREAVLGLARELGAAIALLERSAGIEPRINTVHGGDA